MEIDSLGRDRQGHAHIHTKKKSLRTQNKSGTPNSPPFPSFLITLWTTAAGKLEIVCHCFTCHPLFWTVTTLVES